MAIGLKKITGGMTDTPAMEDAFHIEPYINGLCEFITTCTAPMTVSIQGDWGTGKTSIMQMTKKKLEENKDIHMVWFNTWQFSQFNMGEQLPLLFMTKLINEIEDKKENVKSKSREIVSNLLKLSASMAIGSVSGGSVSLDDLNGLVSGDFFSEFENLKKTFQELIDAKAKGENEKVVIFVDDLDRLAPGRAVELLEVLKIFLDCKKCVFVLAIDYGVVSRGVREKYGEDFGEEKGKSFFDKIIQVPFKMPVASYDISNYVLKCFEEIGICIQKENISIFVKLINHSIGNNPRSMKRLFNSYLLLNKVAVSELLEDDRNKSLLFAILCMQSKYEKIYNHMVNNRVEIDKGYLESLADEHSNLFEEVEMDEREKSKFIPFAKDLLTLIDLDNQGGIDDDELESFKNVLNFSTITSANAETEETDDALIMSYRRKHKDICRNVILPVLVTKYAEAGFTDYYTTKYDKGSWWVYIRNENGVQNSNGKKTRLGFEMRLDPPKKQGDKISTVNFDIYKIDIKGEKTSINDLVGVVSENPLSDLGIEPKVKSSGIFYDEVMSFDADNQEEFSKIADLFIKEFEQVKKFIL